MTTHFGDRLVRAIREKKAPACVGLDPLIERLPATLLKDHGISTGGENDSPKDASPRAAAEALLAFGWEIIRVIAPYVPAVKINIAFFERYYADGVRAYLELVKHARQAGLIVIGDVKRADIGHSTTQYAHAQLADIAHPEAGPVATPDAVTVNPYFGFDAIRPFVEIACTQGRGLFVLVQTSNESAGEIQGLELSDGFVLCERVARIVQAWACGEDLIGTEQYSCMGAVVSPRDLTSTERIRALMPSCLFLVPGFGAQGRTVAEVASCFKADGTGAIVNASRSVIYAYQDQRYSDRFGNDWRRCVEEGCKDFVDAIRAAVPTL